MAALDPSQGTADDWHAAGMVLLNVTERRFAAIAER
jgi:hypothetical protein